MHDHAAGELPGLEPPDERHAAGDVILLGEPDPGLCRPILGLLEGDGHEVLQAEDFQGLMDAVFLRGEMLSAGVLDVDMLVRGDADLVERLHAVRPGLPVLVLAPLGRNLPRLETAFLHTVRILRKPLDPVMVRSRVRELLGMSGTAERRAFPRMAPGVPVAVRLADGRRLPVQDISLGGIAMISDRAFAPGETLDFSFRMVSGFATVVRTSPFPARGPFPGTNHLVRCRFGAAMHPADVEVLMELMH